MPLCRLLVGLQHRKVADQAGEAFADVEKLGGVVLELEGRGAKGRVAKDIRAGPGSSNANYKKVRRTVESIATPCSVKAWGRYLVCFPCGSDFVLDATSSAFSTTCNLKITVCDLKIATSSRVSWDRRHLHLARQVVCASQGWRGALPVFPYAAANQFV